MIDLTIERLISEVMVQISMAGLIGSHMCNHVPEASILVELIVIYGFLVGLHFVPVLKVGVLGVELL